MDSIEEFERVVDAIYGVYLDSTSGFHKLLTDMQAQQLQTMELIRERYPDLANPEHLDNAWMMYGDEDPNGPTPSYLHRTTQAEYKQRNSPQGLNYLFIGNMALVSIYQFWEDHYRSEIARLLGKQKKDLLAPVMGDIRHIRNSIIHHVGIALPDVEKCELLQWFKEDETIYLDSTKIKMMISQIKEMLVGYRAELDRRAPHGNGS